MASRESTTSTSQHGKKRSRNHGSSALRRRKRQRTLPSNEKDVIYTKLIVSQNVRGLVINSGGISASSKFTVLLRPEKQTVEVYGIIHGQHIMFKGRKYKKYISGSHIKYAPSRGEFIENDIPRSHFSNIGRSYDLPGIPEGCTFFLKSITLKDTCSVHILSPTAVDQSQFSQSFTIELFDQALFKSKLCVKHLVLLMRGKSVFDARQYIEGRDGRFDSIVLSLEANMSGSTNLRGISSKISLKLVVQSNDVRCKLTALNECEIEKICVGRLKKLPKTCKIKRAKVEEPITSTTTTTQTVHNIPSATNDDVMIVTSGVGQMMYINNMGMSYSPVVDRIIQSSNSNFTPNDVINALNASLNTSRREDDYKESFKATESDKKNDVLFTISGNLNFKDREVKDDEDPCTICMVNLACVLFGCGHYVTCRECSELYQRKRDDCSYCRAKVTNAIIPIKGQVNS